MTASSQSCPASSPRRACARLGKFKLAPACLALAAFAGAGIARGDATTYELSGLHTEEFYLGTGTGIFSVAGEATVAGRVYGSTSSSQSSIPNGGVLIKTGAGTLTLTGTMNWFAGNSTVAEGALVATSGAALGTGNMSVAPGALLVFSGLRGDAYRGAIAGGGALEIRDSDMLLNYRGGSVSAATAAMNNVFATLRVTAGSRLRAIASGTLSSVLGGAGASVFVGQNSMLTLGREGVVGGSAGFLSPINYSIGVLNLSVDETSALVLNPSAHLVVGGTLALAEGARVTFGGAGVSRLEYAALDAPAPDAGAAAFDPFVAAPAGCTVKTVTLTSVGATRKDFFVVNQAANPLQDIALTLGALETAAATVASRLNENFLQPAARRASGWGRRNRRWTNSAWLRYFAGGEDHETGAGAGAPGHSARHAGLVLGVDCVRNENLLLGLHGGIAENNLSTTNNSSLRTKQHLYGAHITPRFRRLYFTADILGGGADTDSFRNEPAGATSGVWQSNFAGGGAELGAIFRPWKNGILRPRVALRYTRVKVSALDEDGPGAMRIEDFSDELVRLTAGAEAAHKFTLPWVKRAAVASASLALKRAVRSPRASVDAVFADAPEFGAVAIERGDYYKDTVQLGAGLRAAVTKDITAGADINYERASALQRITAGLIIECAW
jgi:autotransporter-associated beta strand protein